MHIKKVTLFGDGISLEPLSFCHETGLAEAVRDGELWKLNVTQIPHPDKLPSYIFEADLASRRGEELVFAIIDNRRGQVLGSTRFRRISIQHRKAIIGPTFIAASWQGSFVNRESKYLLLKYAFETWSLNRIEMLCDVLNTRSRNAIRRLGATEEGVIRHHWVMPDGRLRDTVVHSILRSEWPEVCGNLEENLYSQVYGLSA